MRLQFVYINNKNAKKYLDAVLAWLRREYYEKLPEENKETEELIEALEKISLEGESADVEPNLLNEIIAMYQGYTAQLGTESIDREVPNINITHFADIFIKSLRFSTPAMGSFWHNRTTISESFEASKAMIVINEQEEVVVGFMTWQIFNHVAEIDIVQVRAAYRRHGIFKRMLINFSRNFSKLCLLIVNALPEAVPVFRHMGWQEIRNINFKRRYCKILKPVLEPFESLPHNRAIAIFLMEDMPDTEEYVDYCLVNENPNYFPKKYFQIDLELNGKLRKPIIAPFHLDGYMGIYFNGKLIVEGKPKNLFLSEKNPSYRDINMLVITKLKAKYFEVPVAESLQRAGFFRILRSRKRTHPRSIPRKRSILRQAK